MTTVSLAGIEGSPIVHMITSGEATRENYDELRGPLLRSFDEAAQTGIDFIQIREKQLPDRNVFQLATDAAAHLKGSNTRLLINERFDVAIAAKAAGVHLPSSSIPIQAVKNSCPAEFLIGASTHSLEEALEAQRRGADYVMFGPVFDTPSKRKYGSPQGLDSLRRVCEELAGRTVIAVGGINEERIDEVTGAGAAGFAAIRMFSSFNSE